MKDKAQFTVQAGACAVNLTQYFAVYLVFEHLFLMQCAPSGGLYKNVKMSVKTADKIILLGIIVLVVLIVAAVCGAEPSEPQNIPNGSPTEVWEVTQAETK